MPGQSGDPHAAHYSDLFKMWAEGRYFPIYFTRGKIESMAEKTVLLVPIPGRH
jgi:penicillin amidase